MPNIAANLFKRALAQSSAPAVSFGGRTLGFGEFAERIRRIAGSLRSREALAEGDRVVLCMENRPEFLELLFACWTAGLCAVPVNVKLHAREVAHIVADSGARAVFTDESSVEGLAGAFRQLAAPPVLRVAGSQGCQELAEGGAIGCVPVAPTDVAWIFYTSGTTGKPKGAMLTHRNLLSMAYAYYADIERVEVGDTKLHAASLSHGSGLYSLPHLFGGGHQIIQSGFEPQDVLEAFERHDRVTMFAAPTMVTRLLHAAGPGGKFKGLRTLNYGGGPMYVSDLSRALDLFGARMYQLYGQGESPMTITGLAKHDHEGDRAPAHLARLASCGIPRTGVEVRIVDASGEELPTGEPGEVITRSDCVMAGYWNNLEASSSALRNGWLWTGDVGSIDELGYLTLRDRSKDMIISGGTNIYPREIEEVLLQHPDLLECSVVGKPHPDWGEEGIAFVVFKPGALASTRELDDLCLGHIARFKRPRGYRVIAALPKNNYGKVLKTSLRQTLLEEDKPA